MRDEEEEGSSEEEIHAAAGDMRILKLSQIKSLGGTLHSGFVWEFSQNLYGKPSTMHLTLIMLRFNCITSLDFLLTNN